MNSVLLKKYCVALLGVSLLAAIAPSPISAANRDTIPTLLEPWVDWVLADHKNLDCPVVDGTASCLWPGALTLILDDDGGTFGMNVVSDREIPTPLPGTIERWPEQVTLDGRVAAVFERDGRPSLTIPQGAHRIEGRFFWPELPEALSVPPVVARVTLTVRNERVPFPKRDDAGKVWLTGGSDRESGETIAISVARRIEDGIPLMIETRIVLRASGKAREVTLTDVLLDNTVPVRITAPIPARLDETGNMTLQVRPGTHAISVFARAQRIPDTLTLNEHPEPWPDEEVWVWRSNEQLRQVTLSGLPGVDPSRTDLVASWRTLPAYLVTPGDTLKITTSRRGEPSPPPDRVQLERKMWLDLDGQGFTVQDRLTGELSRTARIDLSPPGKLERATVNGRDELVTIGTDGESGVEIREAPLDLVAEWRLIPKGRAVPAVGWNRDMQSLSTTLYLPPGWRLLFATGVDAVYNTWWDQWDLFSFFFVLIIAIAVGKLTRWFVGLTALVALVLCQHEAGAPFVVWAALVVTLALLKVVPQGKTRLGVQAAWWISLVWLAAVLIPFSVQQMRYGLYPQVAGLRHFSYDGDGEFFASVAKAPPAPEAEPEMDEDAPMTQAVQAVQQEAVAGKAGTANDIAELKQALSNRGNLEENNRRQKKRLKSKSYQSAQMTQDPKAVVQTGIGVPSWSWQQWALTWSGPVVRDHTMKLYMSSPVINLILSVLRVLLLVIIALRLGFEGRRKVDSNGTNRSKGTPKTAVLSVLFAGIVFLALPPSASAISNPSEQSVPSAELLEKLEQRLTEPPQCLPSCVALPHLELLVSDDALKMVLEVNAAAQSAVPIPGPAKNWTPSRVIVDDRETDAAAVLPNGYLYVRISPGVHRVELTGPMPESGALSLTFQMAPKRITAAADHWTIDGLRTDGRVDDAIQLTRKVETDRDEDDRSTPFDEGAYPPWLEIRREILIGIPWTVNTTVRRTSPEGTPILVSIPLLPGESVTASDLETVNGAVKVALARDASTVAWTSTLSERKQLRLEASKGVPWSEIWQFECSPVWQCAFDGPAPISRKSDNHLKPLFRPRPGETLTVSMSKPVGLEGASVTIDSTALVLSPGKRLVKAALTLNIRTSRGGEQVLTLPEGATLQTVEVDDKPHPYRLSGNRVHISLKTGAQTILAEWQEPGGMSLLFKTRRITLGRQAANVKVTIEIPRERWLILLGGPNWGPAILFWGFLLTILLGGLILGRFKWSPLKSREWMLLSVGLTQVPVAVTLIIVSWFLIFSWREKSPLEHRILHNGAQIATAIWSLVALGCLVAAIYAGLAVNPDMQVEGFGSTGYSLNWYTDRVVDGFPTPWILSVPILVWKISMLLWALWLSASMIKWGPWGWRAFSGAGLWRPALKKTTDANPLAPPADKKNPPDVGASPPLGNKSVTKTD